MIVCYARELKHGFVNYIEDTVKIMVPLLKFYFHDDILFYLFYLWIHSNYFIDSLTTFSSKSRVRTAAAESLPFLLDCAKVRGDSYIFELWNFIFPELLKAIETEPEKDVLSELMTSLSQVLRNKFHFWSIHLFLSSICSVSKN